MDIGAIRADLANVLDGLGWKAFAYIPEDVKTLPAAAVNPPTEIDYGYSLTLTQIALAITLYVSTNNTKTAQARLDTALSTGITGSIYDALKADVTHTSWRSVDVNGAGNIRLVEVGNARAIAIDMNITLIG